MGEYSGWKWRCAAWVGKVGNRCKTWVEVDERRAPPVPLCEAHDREVGEWYEMRSAWKRGDAPGYASPYQVDADALEALLAKLQKPRAGVLVRTPYRRYEDSFVYFLQRRADGFIKIGHTRNVAGRKRDLEVGAGPTDLLAVAPGTRDTEQELHAFFDDAREFGEWFRPTPSLLLFIKAIAEQESE